MAAALTRHMVACLLLCSVGTASFSQRIPTSSESNAGATGLRPRPKFSLSECSDGDSVCQRDIEKDMQGLEAIKTIHRQIDDDHNGNVDLSESDEFLRDELQYKTDFERQHTLHGEDKFISVDDLWTAWKYSEVYNWTVEQTAAWLSDSVELPQYAETFKKNAIEGSAIPRLAINSAQFLTAIMGIADPIHRQKISLKAMDVVLFGPPKPTHSYLKDTTLLVSLVVAIGGCWFAYVQHRYSQSHIKQMLRDMEGLQRAEDALIQVQEKLGKAQEEHQTAVREKQTIEAKLTDQISRAMQEAERLREARGAEKDGEDGGQHSVSELEEKLRLAEEELEQLRNALKEAERRLEDGGEWRPPMTLQHWLQLTYEIEKKYYSFKKGAADKQLREAKEVVEKIRRKRGTFMGSFRIAHGNILDDVDTRIINARSALAEVTAELKERLHRWAMVEGLCDFNIVNNPGIHHLVTTLGVSIMDTSSKSVRNALAYGGSIGAAMVVGSMAHVESNASMGLDECDEDMPPPPTHIPPVSDTSLHVSSVLSLSEEQLSLKTSKSAANIASFGSTQSLSHPGASGKGRNTSPRSSANLSDLSKTASSEQQAAAKRVEEAKSPVSDVDRPKTLHISQSENALSGLVGSSVEAGRKNADSPRNGKKSKKDSKKTGSQAEGESDGPEVEEDKKKKRRLRIPGLTSSSKIERLKTC